MPKESDFSRFDPNMHPIGTWWRTSEFMHIHGHAFEFWCMAWERKMCSTSMQLLRRYAQIRIRFACWTFFDEDLWLETAVKMQVLYHIAAFGQLICENGNWINDKKMPFSVDTKQTSILSPMAFIIEFKTIYSIPVLWEKNTTTALRATVINHVCFPFCKLFIAVS